MVGFSHIQRFATLRKTYPKLSWRNDKPPTYDDSLFLDLSETATVIPTALPEDKWLVVWDKLSLDTVRAFNKFLQHQEKSLYPFFLYVFEVFLILGGNDVLASSGHSGPSSESPPTSPESSRKPQTAGRQPTSKQGQPPAEGAGSGGAASGTLTAHPAGSDPASLKMQHEENLRRNGVGGPCEFLVRRGRSYTAVVEAKHSLRTNWEASACQVAAQMYTLAGVNFETEGTTGPVYGILTDQEDWVLFELVTSKLALGQSVEASVSYSAVMSCFTTRRPTTLQVADIDDLKLVVGWICSCLIPGLSTMSTEQMRQKLLDYQNTMVEQAKRLLVAGHVFHITGQKRKERS
ncbi:hypothetical protein WJX72_011215 [[Myrmecia] bisecta]|uniref:Uncharacterized protein n=1 Tax=[Myrmecia] bisecta TaxID=41462 RepID=A0AAW1Q4J3_9CHLO